ncbi:MAG: heme-binding protein [Bradyrhizobium sp.]
MAKNVSMRAPKRKKPQALSHRPEPVHKRGSLYKPLEMGVKNSGSTPMRSFGIPRAAIVLAATSLSALASPASAQLLSHKDLTASIAMTIAQTAIETCKANGYAVSVTVVGRNGEVILQVRGDNTGPHTFENSFRKAYTARTFRIPSGELVDRLKADPTLGLIHLTNVIANRGALPIKVGDETIGAAGASGAPGGEKDEACIKAGLDKVADQLK